MYNWHGPRMHLMFLKDLAKGMQGGAMVLIVLIYRIAGKFGKELNSI